MINIKIQKILDILFPDKPSSQQENMAQGYFPGGARCEEPVITWEDSHDHSSNIDAEVWGRSKDGSDLVRFDDHTGFSG